MAIGVNTPMQAVFLHIPETRKKVIADRIVYGLHHNITFSVYETYFAVNMDRMDVGG